MMDSEFKCTVMLAKVAYLAESSSYKARDLYTIRWFCMLLHGAYSVKISVVTNVYLRFDYRLSGSFAGYLFKVKTSSM